MTTTVRAAIAATVLIVPIAVETLFSTDDDAQWSHLAFAASQVAGWLLLLTIALALRERVGGSRWGQRLVIAGCVLQLGFAVGYGAMAAAAGEPDEGIFVLFLAAFLALTAGGLTWGLRIRRQAALAGRGLIAVAALGFLAMAVGADPFHDLLLLSSYAAWVLVGRGAESAPDRGEVSAESRSVSTHR
jgi:hypothetical protein